MEKDVKAYGLVTEPGETTWVSKYVRNENTMHTVQLPRVSLVFVFHS
jgi:hypothetical protein